MKELAGKGVKCGVVTEARRGSITKNWSAPAEAGWGCYQSKHPTAINIQNPIRWSRTCFLPSYGSKAKN